MDESVLINMDDFDDLIPETSSPPPYYDNHSASNFGRSRSGSFSKPPDTPLGPLHNPPPPGYTYAVISQHGFQHSELLTIMSQLAKVEIFLSVLFVAHGAWCPGTNETPYKGVCHTDIVSGIAGILSGGIGMAALVRYRWKSMMVASLILAIISSVGCLIVVVNLAVWLTHLGKMDKDGKNEDGSGVVRSLSVLLLLVAVTAALRSVREILVPFFRQPSGDFADRLSSRVTVVLLGVFSAVLMTSHYWGEPINCWVPAEYPSGWEKFVNQYCYVHGTYYVPVNQPLPWNANIRTQVPVIYYQWVPYVLAVQAILFYLPRLAWKALCKCSALDIAAFSTRYNKIWSEIHDLPENYQKRHEIIANITVSQFWDCLRLYRKRRHRLTLPLCYLVSKSLHTANAVLQWALLNELLSSKRYAFWGFAILQDLWYGRDWQQTGHFPRVTHCDFTRRRPASFQVDTVLCVLTLNLYYEKIFLFFWFWILFVAAVNLISTFSWLWVLCLPTNQRKFVKRYLRATIVPEKKFTESKYSDMEKSNQEASEPCRSRYNDEMQQNTPSEMLASEPERSYQNFKSFTDETLGLDGIFILRVIANNVGEIAAAYLTRALFQNYNFVFVSHCAERKSPVLAVTMDTAYSNSAYINSPKPGLWSAAARNSRKSREHYEGFNSSKGAKEV